VSTVWEHIVARTERVIVGPGSIGRLPKLCTDLGMARVVVVTGHSLREKTPVITAVERLLGSSHAATFSEMREHVPASAALSLADLLARTGADGVVSVGGGSPIDGAKVALHQHDGGVTPHVAIPTTLSAAEFTPIAGVTDDATRVKGGVAGSRLTPRAVILDAEVTVYTPTRLWLSTGIRSVDHAVETVYAPEGDHFANFIALEAIRRLRHWLPASLARPDDIEARQELQVAAWWSILGLPSVTVAPSHPLGRLLGPLVPIGHGITSCVFLPASIEHVAAHSPERVEPLAEAFGVESLGDVGDACRRLIASLGLPTTLGEAGVSEAIIQQLGTMIPADWGGVVRRAAEA
jgi:alcohol dehydrogenase class IV